MGIFNNILYLLQQHLRPLKYFIKSRLILLNPVLIFTLSNSKQANSVRHILYICTIEIFITLQPVLYSWIGINTIGLT